MYIDLQLWFTQTLDWHPCSLRQDSVEISFKEYAMQAELPGTSCNPSLFLLSHTFGKNTENSNETYSKFNDVNFVKMEGY